jgi:hypothetical protein
MIFLGMVIMIPFHTYKILPQDMQAEVLMKFGVYTELIRQTPQLSIELYALNDFYVEIYFDKISEDPVCIKAFNSINELEPYLSLIEIESIFEIK